MKAQTWYWRRNETPTELYLLLETLGETYPVREGDGDCKIIFERSLADGELKVAACGNGVTIKYGSMNAAARGVGMALANRTGDGKIVFKSLGIMLDASRNAVMTVAYFKKWLRQLALMGYNQAMLYTEDTYQLPGEPYFGYMRGPYTMAEIKEIDAYAKRLGIEVIGCIQALGHLEQALQWSAYDEVRDTRQVLLADEAQTYQLIDKMLAFWHEALSSRRIHIGMDETHDLGRGRFMDKFGYERGFEIFNRHLGKVVELSERYGLVPMIWSDMYFRMSNVNLDYYDQTSRIPDDVKARIPKSVDLVYWDYYHQDKEFYLEWIRRHRELGKEPLMGSGIWTWSRLWCDYEYSRVTVMPCLEACRESKVAEVFFTLWGDDGAYCEFDSALAGLCWAAELAFGHDGNDADIGAFFHAVCGGNYQAQVAAGRLDRSAPGCKDNFTCANWLWDDPLMGKYQREMTNFNPETVSQVIAGYEKILAEIQPHVAECGGGDLTFAGQTATTVMAKLKLRSKLLQAYDSHDRTTLRELIANDIPAMIGALQNWQLAFRQQWLRRNKPFGLDVIQNRIGGQLVRWEELSRCLAEYLDGQIKEIAELEVKLAVHDNKKPDWGGWSKWGISSRSIW